MSLKTAKEEIIKLGDRIKNLSQFSQNVKQECKKLINRLSDKFSKYESEQVTLEKRISSLEEKINNKKDSSNTTIVYKTQSTPKKKSAYM